MVAAQLAGHSRVTLVVDCVNGSSLEASGGRPSRGSHCYTSSRPPARVASRRYSPLDWALEAPTGGFFSINTRDFEAVFPERYPSW